MKTISDYMANYEAPSQYDFNMLYKRATRKSATKKDRMLLLIWMIRYSSNDWNGECYDIGNGLSLYPIEKPCAFNDDGTPYAWDYIDAEIK